MQRTDAGPAAPTRASPPYGIEVHEVRRCSGAHDSSIYANMRATELKNARTHSHDARYIRVRRLLVDWISEVGNDYRLAPSTAHAAVALLDRFLSLMNVHKGRLQLAAMACFLIAAKYEEAEENVPSATIVSRYANDMYDLKLIYQMEILVLMKLNWSLATPTTLHYVGYFHTKGMVFRSDTMAYRPLVQKVLRYLQKYTDFFADLVLQDYYFHQFPPSLLAAAVALSARRSLVIRPLWSPELAQLVGYSEAEVVPLAESVWGHYGDQFPEECENQAANASEADRLAVAAGRASLATLPAYASAWAAAQHRVAAERGAAAAEWGATAAAAEPGSAAMQVSPGGYGNQLRVGSDMGSDMAVSPGQAFSSSGGAALGLGGAFLAPSPGAVGPGAAAFAQTPAESMRPVAYGAPRQQQQHAGGGEDSSLALTFSPVVPPASRGSEATTVTGAGSAQPLSGVSGTSSSSSFGRSVQIELDDSGVRAVDFASPLSVGFAAVASSSGGGSLGLGGGNRWGGDAPSHPSHALNPLPLIAAFGRGGGSATCGQGGGSAWGSGGASFPANGGPAQLVHAPLVSPLPPAAGSIFHAKSAAGSAKALELPAGRVNALN